MEDNLATITATSTSYADVSSAIASSTYGDTVIVPAGSSSWSSVLTISKYITLRGAGIGNTVITSLLTSSSEALITYTPDATSRSADGLVKIKNFTFNGNTLSGHGIDIVNDTTTVITQVHITRCKFLDFSGTSSRGIQINGFVYGLVNKNEFDNCYKSCDVYGKYWDSWEQLPISVGSVNSFYIENNTFANGYATTTGGHGGKYVFRYNTIDAPQSYDILDMHGNQSPVDEEHRNHHRGCMGAEIYENTITNFGSNSAAGRFLAIRGGTAIVYNNTITGSESGCIINFREEDGKRYGMVPSIIENGGTYYKCKLNHTAEASNEPGVGGSWATYWNTSSQSPTAWVVSTPISLTDVKTNGGSVFICYLAHTSSSGTEPGVGPSWEEYYKRVDWTITEDYKYSPGYDEVKDSYLWGNTYNAGNITPTYENVEAEAFIIKDRDYFLVEDTNYTPLAYPHPLETYGETYVAFTI